MPDPLLPIRTNKDIESGYVRINPSDYFFVTFESSKQISIDDIECPLTKGINDHQIISSPNDSVCAMTASWDGSNSSYWYTVRKILSERTSNYSLTATQPVDEQLGIISIRKNFYDMALATGSVTATVTGTNFVGNSIADTYYDDGNGNFLKLSNGLSIGKVLYDDGMIVIDNAEYREVATSTTSLVFNTRVQHTALNVYCKCESNELNYTLNHTAAATASLCANGESIEAGHDNLYTKTSITGSTDRFKYWEDLVSSGYNFSPMITSVGLYNENNELLAVAKLTKPIKKPTDLPLTVKIAIDI
jgi:PPE-repeat protein